MAEIKAFCGLRYNKEFTPDLSCVLAPPYDSIDEEERHVLYSCQYRNCFEWLHAGIPDLYTGAWNYIKKKGYSL